jgi:hypothetical protein
VDGDELAMIVERKSIQKLGPGRVGPDLGFTCRTFLEGRGTPNMRTFAKQTKERKKKRIQHRERKARG